MTDSRQQAIARRRKAVKVLERAYGLIFHKRNWTIGAMQEVKNGVTCYCALGAIHAAARLEYPDSSTERHKIKMMARGLLEDKIPGRWWPDCSDFDKITRFNDAEVVNHSDVLQVFEEAIQGAGK